MNKIKFVIIFTVFINVVGIGIIIPVLPHYVEDFGATSFQVTLLFAVFAFCSFISSPFLGALSDRIGRRPVLLVSIASTAIGWLVFASAHSIFFLFLGRIIDGMAAGNISIAQNSLVDISKNSKERTSNLGLIGAAFGIGFIVGPLIGGLLSSFSHTIPFWFATALAFIDVFFAFFFLEETHKKRKKKEKIELNPLAPLQRAVKNKILLPGFFAWFFFIMATAGIQSTFALYIDSAFGFGPYAAGIFMAAMGGIIALNQVVALKHFWLKYFSEPGIEFWMMLITGVGYFIIGANLLFFFIAGLVITAFGQSVLRSVMTSQILSRSDSNAQGEIIGITSSIMSVAMIIAPIAAGVVFGYADRLPFFLSGIYMLIAFAIIFANRRKLIKA